MNCKFINASGDEETIEVTSQFFFVRCPRANQLCSSTSGAFVAAITVCNQRLFLGGVSTS